jgi:hypothetical protein
MTELTDIELDRHLSTLERDLGPTLRAIYRNDTMRPGFAAQVRVSALNNGSAPTRSRPALRILRLRGWSALAASVVGVAVVVGVVLTNQARPVSASDVLDQLQTEAVGALGEVTGQCPSQGEAHATGGALVVAAGGPSSGPVTATSPTDMSERLAKGLGVSGERLRQAMIATLHTDVAALPTDPITAIAQQLGKTPAEVCAAFLDPQARGDDRVVVSGSAFGAGDGRPSTVASVNLGGKPINLSAAGADEVREPAQRLGVSAERLLAAIEAAMPPTPPPPPSEDELINRLASNLGMSKDQVRTAIKQVQGSGPVQFVVPLPGLGR